MNKQIIMPIVLHHDKSADYTFSLLLNMGGVALSVYNASWHNTPFTISFNNALRMFMKQDHYTHVMVMNNDISLTSEKFWAINERVGGRQGIFSASCNSPHPEVMSPEGNAGTRLVDWLEFVSPVFSRDVVQDVGYLDEQMTLGWGIDIDYCYRAKQKGYTCTLLQNIQFTHYEHKSQDSHYEYSIKAQDEMDNALLKKYGANWRKTLRFKC